MSPISLVPLHLLPCVLWLHVTLSQRLDVEGVVDWHRRFKACLTGTGMQAAISTSYLLVMSFGRPITDAQRGAVIFWLVSQPDVIDVRIGAGALPSRCGAGSSAGTGKEVSRG